MLVHSNVSEEEVLEHDPVRTKAVNGVVEGGGFVLLDEKVRDPSERISLDNTKAKGFKGKTIGNEGHEEEGCVEGSNEVEELCCGKRMFTEVEWVKLLEGSKRMLLLLQLFIHLALGSRGF